MVTTQGGRAPILSDLMARPSFQATPGTRDLFAPDTDRWRVLTGIFADEASRAGFGQVVTPMFEDIGVFTRLGEASDVVSKELYDFEDKGGRRLALRPELTASVCRAFAQNRQLLPWKSWYAGAAFRQEKSQRGRFRQFDQVGAEVIGSHDPDLDVELIALAVRFYEQLGLVVGAEGPTGLTLLINSLGDKADRPAYLSALTDYFNASLDQLSEQSQQTLAVNPLRVLDSKRPQDAELVAAAPVLADFISAEATAAFERVQQGLDALGITYTVDPRLVRGLDYYTRTTFEFAANSLESAQNAVGGGGRYDGLVADLGGPDEPGVGFALGIDRTLIACDEAGVFATPEVNVDVWVVCTTGGLEAVGIADELRQAGYSVDRSFDNRSMKAQMKAANRSGAAIAVIVGDGEAAAGTVSVRPMRAPSGDTTGGPAEAGQDAGTKQREISRPDLVGTIKELLQP